jgi:hypothetical protein
MFRVADKALSGKEFIANGDRLNGGREAPGKLLL